MKILLLMVQNLFHNIQLNNTYLIILIFFNIQSKNQYEVISSILILINLNHFHGYLYYIQLIHLYLYKINF